MSEPQSDLHPHAQHPLVHFNHVNSMQTVDFRVDSTHTLRMAWKRAYLELKEPHRQDDRLQTEDGADMTPHLDLTLEELRKRHLAQGFHFEIVGRTGGAQR